jgi:predicted lipoprotein with Yx(FWY)xxD motif
MIHPSRLFSTTITIAILSLLSCSKNGSTYTTPTTPVPVTSGPNIKLITDANFGSVLTDSLGKVLYFYTLDAGITSSCISGCAIAWPIFYKSNLKLGDGLDSSDFNVVTRPDGSYQTTYKGWPLYYYQGDAKAGDINGDASGSVWFVAKPDYSVMLLNNILVGSNGIQYNSSYQPGTQTVQYITDPYGRTLYAFSPDKYKKNTYTKPDFSNNATWPVYEIGKVKNIPSILDKSTFDTTAVFGKIQISYKGWPLYYFGPDKQIKGNTKGVSVPTPGVWPIVNQSSTVAPQ